MAKITNRFVHFKTKASFTSRLEAGDIQESSVVFIQDANEIWTHGTYYKCNISEAEVIALINSKGYITEADIPSLTGGASATSGQYVSGVTVSGHNVTVTKAALPTNAETATKLATPRVIAIAGAVSGSATFDGSDNVSINSTLNNFDASKITSGTLSADILPEIPLSKIPAAAIERLYVVDSQSAAMSLTIQEGDVVQIGSGGPMYFCVSESASTFATKFKVFTAGAATSVPWSGVTGAPTKLSQFTNDSGFITSVPAQTWDSITGKPSTLDGYGITDAIKNTTTATATTLAAGASATAVYDKATNKFTFGIPKGATGATGATGAKGDKGDTGSQGPTGPTGPAGAAAGFGTPTVDNSAAGNVGTPSVTVTASGANTSKVFNFKFSNLKGATGAQGPKGDKGDKGDTGATGPAGTYTAGSGISISGNTISADIPVALPNPYALTINGTSYTGSSAVSINTARILSIATLSSSTVSAGYSYNCTSPENISSLSGFSPSNPDSVIISTAKLTFTASNAIKMDGLEDLSGTYYIYCLSYMANGKIAVNGAVYA